MDKSLILKILSTIRGAVEPPRKQQATTKSVAKPTKQETVEVSNNEDELF